MTVEIACQVQYIRSLDFYLAWSPCRTQYAFGPTIDLATERLKNHPRVPTFSPPAITEIAKELLAAGKISDESRLTWLDYEAYRLLRDL